MMSRRGTILGFGATLAAGLAAAALLRGQGERGDSGIDSEVDLARQFLDGARGASPLACEMLLRSMGVGWGWQYINIEPGSEIDVLELIGWGTGRARDPEVVPVLRAGMDDADACVRRVSARLLGRSRLDRAIDSLLEALTGAEPRTRELAALGLGYAEQSSAVDVLIGALDDDAPNVRAAAAWALGEIEDMKAVDPLAKLLDADPDRTVRRAAAVALGNLF